MKTPTLIAAIILLLTLINIPWGYAHAAGPACSVNQKQTRNWTPDQRDELKLSCLEKKKERLSTTECLKLAQTMEYSINAEKARMLCLQGLDSKSTVKECYMITQSMEYADTGDDARWDCLRRFQRTITLQQCKKISSSMSYPANLQRAQEFCLEERK